MRFKAPHRIGMALHPNFSERRDLVTKIWPWKYESVHEW
jgi:hypothetical protein